MKIKEAQITFLVGSEQTTIELYDKISGLHLFDVTLTPKQLSQALSRQSHVECSAEVFPDNVTKCNQKQLIDQMTFEIPDFKWNNSKHIDEIHALALKACAEGWRPDKYYGSQGSFFEKDGKKYARCTIRKWVKEEERAAQ